jgi:hypothetical protein
MAFTLAQFQKVLQRRCKAKMVYAGLDGVTADTVNLDLADPLREGLASLGLGVADLAQVTDADLLPVGPIDASQLLDVAELRALESILGNRASPDQKAIDSQLLHGRFYAQLERTTARKRLQVERQYGIGVATISAGVLDLGLAATIDPATGIPD